MSVIGNQIIQRTLRDDDAPDESKKPAKKSKKAGGERRSIQWISDNGQASPGSLTSESLLLRSDISSQETEELPRYQHVFGFHDGAGKQLSDEALEALGDAMSAASRPPSGESTIPAGYTYLGQFIFHDITWFLAKGGQQFNQASAALDLDSVLGNRFREAERAGSCPVAGPLRVGLTLDGFGDPQTDFGLPEDLPRKPSCDPASDEDIHPAGFPLIPDRRNEGFLQLAQTHLLFIKFYNAVARWHGYNGQTFNETATNRTFVQHVQSVILHDFLERLIDNDVYGDVTTTGKRRVIHPAPITAADPFIVPLEFAAAAGRYGHSMIRPSYPWNRDHTSASFEQLMGLSHQNGDPDEPKLLKIDRDWITDWRQFYDFRPILGAHLPEPSKALKIDTRLADALSTLPEHIREVPPGGISPPDGATFNLAKETLRRQSQFKLASAQDVIDQMNVRMSPQPAIQKLTPLQLEPSGDAPMNAAFAAHPDLAQKTPIWFYVLREAERLGGGRLGPMGSRIVMETLHAAMEASKDSIIPSLPAWLPSLPRKEHHRFTMPDLIAFSGNINPLG